MDREELQAPSWPIGGQVNSVNLETPVDYPNLVSVLTVVAGRLTIAKRESPPIAPS